MDIKVLLFSHLKYELGASELVLTLPDQATTLDVVGAVRHKLKASIAEIPMQVAVNQQYVREPVILQDGDEVAIITPVQGG